MNYKLMLMDLDFTLLDNNRNISDENKNAIKEAEDSGVKIVLCSGRSYMSINRYNDELNLKKDGNYGICYNGGMIYKPVNNQVVVEHKLNKDFAFKIIDECRKFDIDIIVYMSDRFIVENYTKSVDEFSNICGEKPEIIKSFESYIKTDVTKILLKGNKEELEKLAAYVKNTDIYDNTTMFFSSKDLFEFVKKGIDKGNALCELSKIMNIDRKYIIAVGDNYNDINMIKKAGLGIAVNNASDDIKKYADYVTKKNNNESAIKEIVNKFILNI